LSVIALQGFGSNDPSAPISGRERERQREQQVTELYFKARQAEIFQSNVEAAARNALAYRARQTLMNELETLINSPPLPSEPEVLTENVYVSEDEAGSPHLGDRDFSVDAFMKKPRSWW
jgi:hypothetical protein